MSKVFIYVVMCTGMMLLLNMMGVPTGVDSILNFLGVSIEGQTISLAQFTTTLLAIIASSAGVGIIVGLLTRSSPESFIAAPFVTLLAVFIGTFASVVNYTSALSSWVFYVSILLFLPIAIGYGIALIEWWRGVG